MELSIDECGGYIIMSIYISPTCLTKGTKTKTQGPVILPVVLYGCKTFSLKLQKKIEFENILEEGAEENI
jgi:hypothetical protein